VGEWKLDPCYAGKCEILWKGPDFSDMERSTELESLIRRCNQGDKRAWEELYARFHGLISSVVNKYGMPGTDEVEDMTQEVFINLFKALKNYDPARPIEAYILSIARRVRISRLRKISAQKRGGGNPGNRVLDALDGSDEESSVAVASPADDQETRLIRAQEKRLLRRALSDLSEACRSILAMRYEEGLSYKQMSEALVVKEGTLRVRVQRCLSSLSRVYSTLLTQEAGFP
jgi:RNA polymerase sigma-70 factor (ECF subfamily)